MEELLGRQAPHSAPAEQAVIGAMLIDPSCIPDVIEKVKSDEGASAKAPAKAAAKPAATTDANPQSEAA